jgi:RimJ/RimL family protein N-acetyltransferase
MTWSTTDDLDEFLARAGQFLHAEPVLNTVPLTVLAALRSRGPAAFGEAAPWYGWWDPSGGAVGPAFLQTPPHPVLLVGSAPDAVTELARLLVERPRIGVNLVTEAAAGFGQEWQRRTGLEPSVDRQVRLHRLTTLTPPGPEVPGRPRLAEPADRDQALFWFDEFAREIGELSHHPERAVDDRIAAGLLMLWQVGGEPVSMAGLTQPEGGVARVAPVYTPVALRRHGYASAVTAAVSQAALDRGAEHVVLFTDLANPTSNSVYHRLGYRPVQDRVVLDLTVAT